MIKYFKLKDIDFIIILYNIKQNKKQSSNS